MQIENNIKKLTEDIEKMRIDVYRMEGSLKMLLALKDSGLSELELPEKKEEEKDV